MTRTILVAAALTLAASFGGPAQAMPMTGPLPADAAGTSLIEKAQFVYGGRRYCFYVDGWHGPGWYWCGYATRRGYGWGGVEGWHGWRYGRHDHHDHHHDDHHDHHHGGGHHH